MNRQKYIFVFFRNESVKMIFFFIFQNKNVFSLTVFRKIMMSTRNSRVQKEVLEEDIFTWNKPKW